jgi:hypothetical protein
MYYAPLHPDSLTWIPHAQLWDVTNKIDSLAELDLMLNYKVNSFHLI